MIAINGLFLRIYENCSVQDFWKFRCYFEGTQNINLFPNGLQIEGIEHEPIICMGMSGAQSALLQSFDIFFDIVHEGHSKSFFTQMRKHMPAENREYLESLTQGVNIRDYVFRTGDKELEKVFEDAITRFTILRQTHLKIVHDYVFRVIKRPDIKSLGLYKGDGFGTAGSDAKTFLEKTIRETRNGKKKRPHNDQSITVDKNPITINKFYNSNLFTLFSGMLFAFFLCQILFLFY